MTDKADVTLEINDKLLDATEGLEITDGAAKKKKKNKKKKKDTEQQNGEAESPTDQPETVDNGQKEKVEGEGENVAAKKKKNKNKKKTGKAQTDPPSLPVSQLFPDGNFPEGQIMEHPIAANDQKAKDRFTSEEARALDRLQLDMYNEIRQVKL